MQIIENKAVVLRTRFPEKLAVIPKHKILEELPGGGAEAMVYWGLDEVRVLRNLGFSKVPSPIVGRYDFPGRYRPMAHQIETSAFFTLNRRCFCFNEPGTGKTLSALWAADYLMNRGEVRRVLVVCPMSIMHSAWLGDIGNSIIHRSAIVAHHPKASRRIEMVQGNYEIVITNYEGLELIGHEVRSDGRFDLVIVDECFVAGTPVLSPRGPTPIEQLKAGDEVLTSAGVKRIKTLVRKTTKRLVRVETSDGQAITCTPEHPFFTDVGWVTAEHLAGRRLVSAHEVPGVQLHVSGPEGAVHVAPLEGYEHRVDLFKILRSEEAPRAESGSELLQPHAAGRTGNTGGHSEDAGTAGAPFACAESNRAQAANARWQRNGYDFVREAGVGGAAWGLGVELPRSVGEEAARLSYELQARLCAPRVEDGAGSGRRQSQQRISTSAGSQERTEAGAVRVVRVSHIECGSEVPVFNLEVEGVPNYFVGNGQLVHNCNAYKNNSTQRWKALNSILTKDTYLWMMTGTPASQSPEDAYGLAKLVCPQRVPNFRTAWKDRVMLKISTFKWVARPNARDLVFDALQPAIRFTKAQCLDLPPVITETREVPMTPQQAKYYKALKEQLSVQAAGETITAVNAGVAISKLLQISAGAAYTDGREVVEFDAKPRLNALLEVLEETDRKVIIFALFRSSMDTIADFLAKKGINCTQIHGDVSPGKRGQIINDFQSTDNVRVLVMQPQATAHGITLTAADTVVFYGPLMSVELYLQCIARADRKGQTSDKVRVIHLQSSPVEQKMFKAMTTRVNDHSLLVGLFDEEIKQ